jgi:trk system potassium uptake protein TrkA
MGIHLINSILEKGDRLIVIDRLEETCQKISKQHPNIQTIFGDGTDLETLKKAEAEKADALVAATNSDSVNLVICELAKNKFHIPHVITILNNPRNRNIFEERRIVETIICPTEMATAFFETTVHRHDLITLLHMRGEDYKVVEFIVLPHSQLIGKKISEITIPNTSKIGMVKREGVNIFPDQNFAFSANDRLFIYGTVEGVEKAVETLREYSFSKPASSG